MTTDKIIKVIQEVHEQFKGGSGSGNFGHSGRPGKRGGSAGGGSMGGSSNSEAAAALHSIRRNLTQLSSDASAVRDMASLQDIRVKLTPVSHMLSVNKHPQAAELESKIDKARSMIFNTNLEKDVKPVAKAVENIIDDVRRQIFNIPGE